MCPAIAARKWRSASAHCFASELHVAEPEVRLRVGRDPRSGSVSSACRSVGPFELAGRHLREPAPRARACPSGSGRARRDTASLRRRRSRAPAAARRPPDPPRPVPSAWRRESRSTRSFRAARLRRDPTSTRLRVSAGSIATSKSSGFGAAMYLNSAGAHRAQRAPSEVEQRRKRLRVELARWRLAPAQRPASSMPSLSNRATPSCEQHRGRKVHEPDSAADDGRRDPWTGDDQRHPQRRVVDEQAVADFAVLAERLAVVGGDDDQRGRRVVSERLRAPGRPADPLRRSHRRTARATGRRSDGSPYGACGSNRWTHRKKRCGAMLAQPRDRLVHDDAAGPFVGGAPVRRRAACDRRRSGSP